MALVPRRILQPILEENARLLTAEQSRTHVTRLNGADAADSLACEYEVLILNALAKAKVGSVEHEPHLPGRRRPDLLFRATSGPTFEFIADITTVSDEGFRKENPLDLLDAEFSQLVRRLALASGGFHFDVGGCLAARREGERMLLKLPRKADIPRFARQHLTGFLRGIQKEPLRPATIAFRTAEIELKVTYDPARRPSFSANYPSFSVPYSLRNNPVAQRLENKARKLKQSGYAGIGGVILCDGDCAILRGLGSSFTHYSEAAIMAEFFRRHASVTFVLCLTVKEPSPYARRTPPAFKTRLFINARGRHRCPLPLQELLRDLPSLLAPPQSTPARALDLLRSRFPSRGWSFYGEFSMTRNTIRISARSLIELLAGEHDLGRFLGAHGFVPSEQSPDAINFFKGKLQEGRTIRAARIEKDPARDDDWLVLEFGEADPAISPFRQPK